MTATEKAGVPLTPEQKKQVHNILVTHLAWVQRKFGAADEKNPGEHAFYRQRITITEALLPLFAAAPEPEEVDEDAESEESIFEDEEEET